MIISHEYKFIFIKTRETAGTSIETFLSQHCGADDIFTPITPCMAAHEPRSHEGFYNHMPAHEIRDQIGGEIWGEYFKFCVERNPWDKMLSFYYFVRAFRYEGNPTLDDFFELELSCVDWLLYTDPLHPQTLMVDKVLRYEALAVGLSEVFSSLGVPFNGSLGVNAKSEFRTNRRPYQEIFTAEQAKKIEAAFDLEIQRFKYKF